jgi:CRISPR/Cas system-associated exonuclease Cas4 (RecB family)
MTVYLSKSLLNSFRQCPRRLWLELQDNRARREGRSAIAKKQYSADTQKRFAEGHVVGRIAQAMWPNGIDIEAAVLKATEGKKRDLNKSKLLSQQVMGKARPLFEATFEYEALLIQADVMLPARDGWRMLEVKSSSSPKAYHYADLATQAWVVERSGISLSKVGLLLVNKNFELKSVGDYTGFLQIHDDEILQESVREHMAAMPTTVNVARQVAEQAKEPTQYEPGAQCTDPFECPYQSHCSAIVCKPSAAEVPIHFYRDKGAEKAQQLIQRGFSDLRQVPEEIINLTWDKSSEAHRINRRLAMAVRTGQPILDREAARKALDVFAWPVQHLDFETINLTAPVWPGTQSGQQIPFQYSLDSQNRDGSVVPNSHREFLDVSGKDPRRALAQRLVKDLSPDRTILAWNASFERTVISSLAEQFPDLKTALLRLLDRVEDLLPVVRQNYAHPVMARITTPMFSIKTVLPMLVPSMNYDQLDGVQNGGDAQASYLRVAAPKSLRNRAGYLEVERQAEIKNMLRYCAMDTEAMVAITSELLAS